MPTATELRESVTNQILEALQNGVAPWRRPWKSHPCFGSPKNISSRSYSGVNPLLLTLASMKYEFKSRYWATFNQWKEIGACVKPRPSDVPAGKWGTTIVFSKPCTKKDKNGEETDEKFWLLRSFVVFNADQVTGAAAEKYQVQDGDTDDRQVVVPSYEEADQLIENTGADIRYGGDQAFYQPKGDFIQLPHKHNFTVEDHYPTVFHELSHWAEPRLSWDREGNGYAMGELIAELASCYVCSELNIPIAESLGNHAAYLKHWIEQMKGDSRFIFKATSQASKAADFLMSFKPQPVVEEREPLIV